MVSSPSSSCSYADVSWSLLLSSLSALQSIGVPADVMVTSSSGVLSLSILSSCVGDETPGDGERDAPSIPCIGVPIFCGSVSIVLISFLHCSKRC